LEIDRAERSARQGRASDAKEDTIVSIGRLIDIKNLLLPSRAFALAQDPTARLLFIGQATTMLSRSSP
jgi:hypothetical protein